MKKAMRALIMAVMIFFAFGALAQSKSKNLDIVFIGNSITYGANLDSPKIQAPPVAGSKYLSGQFGIGTVQYSNQGHSGYTILDFLPATPAFMMAESAAKSFAGNDALLIFSIDLGTNDSAIKGPHGAPLNPKDYRANLKTITDALLMDFHGCMVIIHHPIWYSPNTYNGAMYLQEGLDRLQTYFPEIDGLVADYSKTTPNQVFVGDIEAFDYFKKNYLTDLTPEAGHQGTFYLHPNNKGAAVLGTYWAKAIVSVIKSLPQTKQ